MKSYLTNLLDQGIITVDADGTVRVTPKTWELMTTLPEGGTYPKSDKKYEFKGGNAKHSKKDDDDD